MGSGKNRVTRIDLVKTSLQTEETGTDDSDTARLDISSYESIIRSVYDDNFEQQDKLSACIPARSPSKCTAVSLRKWMDAMILLYHVLMASALGGGGGREQEKLP